MNAQTGKQDTTTTVYTAESIVPFIGAILPGIEIVNFHFVDWTAVGANAIAANNAIHGAWIDGKPITDWQRLDLATHRVTVTVNEQPYVAYAYCTSL